MEVQLFMFVEIYARCSPKKVNSQINSSIASVFRMTQIELFVSYTMDKIHVRFFFFIFRGYLMVI